MEPLLHLNLVLLLYICIKSKMDILRIKRDLEKFHFSKMSTLNEHGYVDLHSYIHLGQSLWVPTWLVKIYGSPRNVLMNGESRSQVIDELVKFENQV